MRKVLFYILLLVYFIATPYAILYGLGYVMNPREGEWVKTGLLSVVTEPKGATVYLEGKKYSRRTPSVIASLLPGEYHLRIVKKGFEPWEKNIQIVAEKATRLDPAVLLPKIPEKEVLFPDSFHEILPYGDDFKLFVLKKKTLDSLVKIDMLFKKEIPLGAKIPGAEKMEVEKVFSRERSAVVLFKVKKENKTGFLMYDLNRAKIIGDLSAWVPEEIQIVQWQPRKPDYLYTLRAGQLQGINLEHPETGAILVPEVRGLGLVQNRLYYLKNDLSLWQSSFKEEEPAALSPDFPPAGQQALAQFSSKGNYRIEVLKQELFRKDWFLFLDEKGALLSNRPPYNLIKEDVQGFVHSREDHDKLLYWTGKQIGVFDFAFNEEEEESWPPRQVLYDSGRSIRNAVWAFENSHILFQDGNKILLLEAGSAAPFAVREIADTAPGSFMFYRDGQKAVYFLDRDRRLVKRKITE